LIIYSHSSIPILKILAKVCPVDFEKVGLIRIESLKKLINKKQEQNV